MEPFTSKYNPNRDWPIEVGDEIYVEFEWMEAKLYPSGHTEINHLYEGSAIVIGLEHDGRCDETTIEIDAYEMPTEHQNYECTIGEHDVLYNITMMSEFIDYITDEIVKL